MTGCKLIIQLLCKRWSFYKLLCVINTFYSRMYVTHQHVLIENICAVLFCMVSGDMLAIGATNIPALLTLGVDTEESALM